MKNITIETSVIGKPLPVKNDIAVFEDGKEFLAWLTANPGAADRVCKMATDNWVFHTFNGIIRSNAIKVKEGKADKVVKPDKDASVFFLKPLGERSNSSSGEPTKADKTLAATWLKQIAKQLAGDLEAKRRAKRLLFTALKGAASQALPGWTPTEPEIKVSEKLGELPLQDSDFEMLAMEQRVEAARREKAAKKAEAESQARALVLAMAHLNGEEPPSYSPEAGGQEGAIPRDSEDASDPDEADLESEDDDSDGEETDPDKGE